jgi:hypothetical protein
LVGRDEGPGAVVSPELCQELARGCPRSASADAKRERPGAWQERRGALPEQKVVLLELQEPQQQDARPRAAHPFQCLARAAVKLQVSGLLGSAERQAEPVPRGESA